MTKKAIYPGTFDPITEGHINIIQRASNLFDSVVVAVAKSAGKNPLFEMQERVELAKQSLSAYQNVEVIEFQGLLVDLAKQQRSKIIVRGVRSMSDFEYEAQMAGMNKNMLPELETVFLTPSSKWANLSSTLVRDIARHGGDISDFVPANVAESLQKKIG
ncbi:MAG: pantetheine-phosphate adenylyltransferase [Cycloclasticus sp. symbiont of Poecilosclerida sp. M]|nr:MAG: pantetheine-phosphate adenylyltransferase [Cycloclasticus sp. symbiont of Poecilosclerida sp. M]